MEDSQIKAIEVVRGHCLGVNRGDVEPGTILMVPRDISLAEAKTKVAIGHAVVVPAEDQEVDEDVPVGGEITTADPAVETRDPEDATATPSHRPRGGKKSHR